VSCGGGGGGGAALPSIPGGRGRALRCAAARRFRQGPSLGGGAPCHDEILLIFSFIILLYMFCAYLSVLLDWVGLILLVSMLTVSYSFMSPSDFHFRYYFFTFHYCRVDLDPVVLTFIPVSCWFSVRRSVRLTWNVVSVVWALASAVSLGDARRIRPRPLHAHACSSDPPRPRGARASIYSCLLLCFLWAVAFGFRLSCGHALGLHRIRVTADMHACMHACV
jgi:hypothetical protein